MAVALAYLFCVVIDRGRRLAEKAPETRGAAVEKHLEEEERDAEQTLVPRSTRLPALLSDVRSMMLMLMGKRGICWRVTKREQAELRSSIKDYIRNNLVRKAHPVSMHRGR